MDVHLLSGRPIYFPFLSGILDYDCASCDARCCKGGGLGIGRSKELAGLLHISPALALFAGEGFPHSPLPVLETVLEKCWFLDRESLCRLERAVGRYQKPAACRTFPFNQVRSAAEWVVVMPHFLCPLTVQAGPSKTGKTSHDEIALEMHQVGVPRDGHVQLAPPVVSTWTHLIPLERRIREGARTYLGATDYTAYAEYQADLTTMGLLTGARARCDALRARVVACLGYGDGKPSAARVREMVALTSYLRLRVSTAPADILPGMLTALSVLVAVVESMPGTRFTPRTLVQLFEKRALFLHVLAHLMDIPRMQEGYTAEALVRGDPFAVGLVGDLLYAVEANGSGPRPVDLGTLVAGLQGFRPPLTPDAVGALTRLGRYAVEALEFIPP
jgi:Fe-S-cluster containining protein